MSKKILSALFAQKSWSNGELFDVVATAAAATAHAEPLHMATRLLNHIYVVDCIFRAHLLGEKHGHEATNTDETPAIDAHWLKAFHFNSPTVTLDA